MKSAVIIIAPDEHFHFTTEINEVVQRAIEKHEEQYGKLLSHSLCPKFSSDGLCTGKYILSMVFEGK